MIISKILGSTTSIPFSAMSLIGPQEVIIWITKFVLKTNTSSRRLLLDGNSFNTAMICLLVAIGANYILNCIHIWIFCKYIRSDPKFFNNKRKQSTRVADAFILTLASITSYKFYQVVFSKLCNVTTFKTQLSSVSKLFPLKVLNAISIIISLVSIAGSALSIS